MPTAEIEFEDVSLHIGDARLLDQISLSIPRGQRVALIGPSGAGKTTMLRLISGITWPTTGTLHVAGQRTGTLSGKALRQFRRQVGFLHQHNNLIPQLRVAHNVLMGKLGDWSWLQSLWSLLRPREVGLARAALDRVELADRLWALPDELSGGEQQRVALARLLVQEPRIVLADEPVSALDIRLGRAVIQQLFRLVAEEHTLVVSLHSLSLLGEGFDRVLAMRDGRVLHDGPPESLSKTLLQAVYGAELAQIDVASFHSGQKDSS